MKLLSAINSNAKIAKSNKSEKYLSTILHLAPYNVSGYQTCASASAGCASACLNTAGRSVFSNVQDSRVRKTKLFFEDRPEFIRLLKKDIESFVRKCDKEGKEPALRLNGTSDLQWENLIPSLFTDFPSIEFYDYTKHFKRMLKFCNGELPENYHLTFSRSENNQDKALQVLKAGGNVAIVFEELPEYWNGYKVESGDDSDLRFLDYHPICGLSAKGKAKKDKTGFVVLTSSLVGV